MTRKLREGEGKRHQVNFRTTADMRDALHEMASKSGRSLAQEIEFRLAASLRNDDLRQIIREEVRAALAGPDHSGWFKAIDAEYRVERVP